MKKGETNCDEAKQFSPGLATINTKRVSTLTEPQFSYIWLKFKSK